MANGKRYFAVLTGRSDSRPVQWLRVREAAASDRRMVCRIARSRRWAAIAEGTHRGEPMGHDEAEQAREILHAAHLAWTNQDMDKLIDLYDENVVFACNAAEDAPPLRLVGREAMRAFLEPIMRV